MVCIIFYVYYVKFCFFLRTIPEWNNLDNKQHYSKNYCRLLYKSKLYCVVWQAEKKVKELQNELDDLSQRLDEAGGATQAQASSTHMDTTGLFVHSFILGFTGARCPFMHY